MHNNATQNTPHSKAETVVSLDWKKTQNAAGSGRGFWLQSESVFGKCRNF